jgi:hypothetical protein
MTNTLSRDLVEKVIFSGLVKKFPAFYETLSSVVVLTRASHFILYKEPTR